MTRKTDIRVLGVNRVLSHMYRSKSHMNTSMFWWWFTGKIDVLL